MKKDIFKSTAFLNYISDSTDVLPLAMSLDVTNNCNFRCCHCYVKHTFEEKEKEMSLNTIKDIINQMAEYGVPAIYLSGGEALIRKDLIEVVEYAKRKGMNVYIKTNGSLFDDELVERLRLCEVDDIQISIYGMNNDEYALVTNCADEGMFDRVKQNVIKLINAGIKVKLRYIVLKQNYKSCVEFIKWCQEMQLTEEQYFHAVDIQPTSGCGMEPLKYAIDIEEQKELIESIYKVAPEYLKKIYNLPKEYRKCNVGRNTIHINNNGVVYPCPGFALEIGNIYKNSYKEIWEESINLNMLRNVKVEELDCSHCSDNKYCVGNCMGAINNWNNHTSFKCKNATFCKMKKEQIEMLKHYKELGVI